ncbi:MAG: hypothetical protein LBF94_03695 [Puniceicoccales bacterium]|nr:hypothetical protein [Puniceicoccales bacterium]
MSIKKYQDHPNHFAVNVPKLEVMEKHPLTSSLKFLDQAKKVSVREKETAVYEKKSFGSGD